MNADKPVLAGPRLLNGVELCTLLSGIIQPLATKCPGDWSDERELDETGHAVILAAAGLLVALDVVGALAAQPLGFPYSPLGAVSLLLYLTVGVLGALRGSFGWGVVAGASVGFLDGTFGPLAAWLVGPGPVGQTVTEPRVFAYGIAVVTAVATAAGLVGALAGSWLERRRGLRTSSSVVPR